MLCNKKILLDTTLLKVDAFMKNYILPKKSLQYFIFTESEASGYDKIFPAFVSE